MSNQNSNTQAITFFNLDVPKTGVEKNSYKLFKAVFHLNNYPRFQFKILIYTLIKSIIQQNHLLLN